MIAKAQGYFEEVATLTVAGLAANARFGHSVTTTTDGRQIIVGCKDNDITVDGTTYTDAGSVYVFDRNVQKFIYGTDTSSVTFDIIGTVSAPVSVLVNNEFLINQTNSVINGPNSFTVDDDGSSIITVTIEEPLNVGDIVEIETNQFTLVQEVIQQTLNSSNVVVDSPAEFTNFGQAVDICSYNCSLYVGAPQDSVSGWKAGAVHRDVNQSRVYGTITSTIANPTLTAGETLRVNDIDVAVPNAWSSSNIYQQNTVVYNTVDSTTTIYVALQYVPVATAITNPTYWNIVTTTSITSSIGIRALAAQINYTVPNVTATVSTTGYLTLTVKNATAALTGNKLQVAPGSGMVESRSDVSTVFDDIGFDTFVFTQTIYSPYPVDFAGFGYSVNIDTTATNLVVGAPRGTLYYFAVFDDGTTIFDEDSTVFFNTANQSGAVYTYDYLPSASDNVTDPGKFVFGLQIYDSNVESYDNFGVAVDYTDGVLMVGAPGNDSNDSAGGDQGRVFVFENPSRVPAWTVIHNQQPVVDIQLLNGVFTYDRLTSARTQQFDFFNPLQGKILGAAKQNINYIGAVDPAAYNVGAANNIGNSWTAGHVGEMWWDISTVRFIDPNQDDIVYASRRWGQIFSGSTIDIYQWVQSTVPPATYTGTGTPLNILSYTINTQLGIDGVFNTYYYFWVRGITTVATQQGKTLSAQTVSEYIANPKSSGIAYIAPINASTIAIYNGNEIIEASDTIIDIEFDREYTDNNVHVEYELIAQGRADAFLSNNLYRKLQDSFCGVDTSGNLVPDPNLNDAERYGVQFRPRQSMFVDRFTALKNYIKRTNSVLVLYPIVENRSFVLLNSREPEPPATEIVNGETRTNWDMRVANLEILSFQEPMWIEPDGPIPVGYKYLVASDSSNNGFWTVYTVQTIGATTVRRLVLTRVQNYDTRRYWSYIDWYLPGYNSSTKVIAEVANYSALATLNVAVGSSVKVTANAQGKFEIYLLTDLDWERVGLEDGTIEISAEIYDYALGRFGFDVEVFDAQYFDQEPVIETRKIIQAINEELFVGDLLIERNKALTLVFNFVLSEFTAPEWLVKTSLIDVDHNIRNLEPFQNYRQDNQEFVLDYIQEVKPYHVQIREFNLLYNGQDQYLGDVTDFDVPAFYNTDLTVPQYISPILTPYALSTYQQDNTLSDADSTSLIWQAWPYTQWYGNYLLTLETIRVVNSGSGYTNAPLVTILGDAETPATAVSFLNSLGQIAFITVTNSGSGYQSTPTIVIEGGNGSDAQAYPVMNIISTPNPVTGLPTTRYTGLTRGFRTTIKYDRVDYLTQVSTWAANVTYEDGTLVRYDNRVWRATSTDSTAVTGPTFELDQWQLIPAGELSGVDRTFGYYIANVNEPGLDIPLLIDGISYPGVQVWGRPLSKDTTELDQQYPLDATYSSSFTDIYLGTRFSDINVSGGEFIGPYEGHAPEELVNGAEYDTLDIRVFTRPGADWDGNGHGFQIGSQRYIYFAVDPFLEWDGIVENPVALVVSNVTAGVDLVLDVDYTIDWVNRIVEILASVAENEIVNIAVYELGGGSQLYRQNYVGSDLEDFIIIPVNSSEINEIALFVNGEITVVDGWEPYYPGILWDQLDSYNRLDIVYTPGSITSDLSISGTKVTSATTNTYSNLPLTTVTGTGTGATVTVTLTASGTLYNSTTTSITIGSLGYGYAVGDTVKILGTSLGGASPVNDLTITIQNIVTGYYRALQSVPGGIAITNTDYWFEFVPTTLSKVMLFNTYGATDALNLTAIGLSTINAGNFTIGETYTIAQLGNTNFVSIGALSNTIGVTFVATGVGTGTGTATVDFSWSTAQTQYFTVDATINSSNTVTLANSLSGTNVPNMVVEIDGVRLRPYEGIEHAGDGVTTSFGLPQRGGYQQSIINPANDITVYVNGVLQTQGTVYSVTNWTGSNTPGRQVVFVTAPATGAAILISVSSVAEYYVAGTQLQLVSAPSIGSTIAVTTWNDTSQQNALTLVFEGPDTSLSPVSNNFDLDRVITNSGRLWVTLNGDRLFDGEDFLVNGQYLLLSTGTIGSSDVLVVTEFTDSIVPESIAFRVFQDMRGVQATYRITDATSTFLTQTLISTADVIHVDNAGRLTQPDLPNGIFGVITINGERIMYRVCDVGTNTVSGLMRGTAGTGAATHPVESLVYDIGRGNLLYQSYQDYIDKQTWGALCTDSNATSCDPDRTAGQIVFTADIGPVDAGDSAGIDARAIEVYVGGVKQVQYLEVTAANLEVGLTYNIDTLGTTDWNIVAGTNAITYAINDRVTVLVAGTGTGTAVYQGSEYLWTCTDVTNVTIEFIVNDQVTPPLTAPLDSSDVTILVRRGKTWYQPTATEPSNGQALQETQTQAARFLRGL